MNRYEVVITGCKGLEQLLTSQLGAQGRGLHEKVSSVEHRLTPQLIRKLRFIAAARNRLVHEAAEWSPAELDDYTRACDWARDQIERLTPAETAPPARPAAPVKLVPPRVERLLPVRSAQPPVPRPAPVTDAAPAVLAPRAPALPAVPAHRANRGLPYLSAGPPASVLRFRPRRQIRILVPLLVVMLLAAGVAGVASLLPFEVVIRELVDQGLRPASEWGQAGRQRAAPGAEVAEALPEIVAAPTARAAGSGTRGRKTGATARWSE